MLSNVPHSNFYFECNTERGCIDQLYIELGKYPVFCINSVAYVLKKWKILNLSLLMRAFSRALSRAFSRVFSGVFSGVFSRVFSRNMRKIISVLEKKSTPLPIPKVGLGFCSRYQNLVSVVHYYSIVYYIHRRCFN